MTITELEDLIVQAMRDAKESSDRAIAAQWEWLECDQKYSEAKRRVADLQEQLAHELRTKAGMVDGEGIRQQ